MTFKRETLSPKAKVLVLHGAAQSGDYMKAKTHFLRRILENSSELKAYIPGGVEFVCPDAPHPVLPADLPRHKVDTEDPSSEFSNSRPLELEHAWNWGYGHYTEEVKGFDHSLRYLCKILRTEGPFIGIVGFSTGAMAALVMMSFAERGSSAQLARYLRLDTSILPCQPFLFGILFSGYILSHPLYESLFYPKIQTPVLHFIGKYDTWLLESEMLKLSESCKNVKTEYHQGSHFVAKYKSCQKIMLGFVTEQMQKLDPGTKNTLSCLRGCCFFGENDREVRLDALWGLKL